MKLVIARHEGAFTELVNRHIHPLYSFVRRFTNDSLDVEDITQDTWVRVWERASTWKEGKVQFKTWLFQIARNLCIDQFRRHNASIDGEIDPDVIMQDPEVPLEREERARLLYRSIAKLPERQRTAIVLCNIQGWSQADVAKILGCTVDAVDALLGRGRRTLRRNLANLEG